MLLRVNTRIIIKNNIIPDLEKRSQITQSLHKGHNVVIFVFRRVLCGPFSDLERTP